MFSPRNVVLLGFGLFTAMGLSCFSYEPDHCANQPGIDVCGNGMFCDRCLGMNNGCTEVEPSEGCGIWAAESDGGTEPLPPDPATSGSDPGPATESSSSSALDDSSTGPGVDVETGESSESTTGEPIACGECPGGPCAADDDVHECGAGFDACMDKIECTAGSPCIVNCNGPGSCDNTTILCPEGEKCEVKCFGDSSCKGARVQCGSGPCSVQCLTKDGACKGLTVECGPNDSHVCANTVQSVGPTLERYDGETACACDYYVNNSCSRDLSG